MTRPFPSVSKSIPITSSCFLKNFSQINPFVQLHCQHPNPEHHPLSANFCSDSFLVSVLASPNPNKKRFLDQESIINQQMFRRHAGGWTWENHKGVVLSGQGTGQVK